MVWVGWLTLSFLDWAPRTGIVGLTILASIVAVEVAVSRLDLGRERLARLGITPWAPSEIGLVPLGIVVAVGAGVHDLGWNPTWGVRALVPLGAGVALATAATIGALVYLDRRLRAAEALAAARERAHAAGREALP